MTWLGKIRNARGSLNGGTYSEAGLLGFLQSMGRWQRPDAISGRRNLSASPVEPHGRSTKQPCGVNATVARSWLTRLLAGAALIGTLAACSPADVFRTAQATRTETTETIFTPTTAPPTTALAQRGLTLPRTGHTKQKPPTSPGCGECLFPPTTTTVPDPTTTTVPAPPACGPFPGFCAEADAG